ncbi:hypothetical protein Tco_0321239 [Tanacetum coccineum]
MELALEQTQQDISYEVPVSAKGVEELKRKVKIKGEKKEALLTLRQNRGDTQVIIMKMEILLEPTSNKLMVVPLQHNEWMPSYADNFTRKVESDGAWNLKCRKCSILNEVVQDDELWTSKLIKFRLEGRDHSLTLLQFAKRLGLYFNEEVGEEGFEIYFHDGLRSDEHFYDREYWLSISSEEDPHLSRSRASKIRKPIQRNQDGYANAAWVIAKWMKRKGAGSQREHDLLWSVHYAYGAKDELLITEAPMPGAPRVAIPVHSRPSMQDLYDSMGDMEIR